MNKTGKYVAFFMWGLIAVTALLALAFISNISDNKLDPDMNSWLSTNLVWAYIMLIISVVLLLIFAIYQMATNFEEAKKGLVAVLFLGGIFLISYLMASDELPKFLGAQKFIDDGIISPKIMKWIDAGLIWSYIILVLSIVSIVYASVSRLFK
jgi:hypothetical protein